MEKARAALTAIEEKLADEALYSDAGRKDEMTSLLKDQSETRSSLESLETEWLEASEELEASS